MGTYKEEYNTLLKRYYNGCIYIKNHPEDGDKFYPELLKILNKMNIILEEHNITDDNIILNGF